MSPAVKDGIWKRRPGVTHVEKLRSGLSDPCGSPCPGALLPWVTDMAADLRSARFFTLGGQGSSRRHVSLSLGRRVSCALAPSEEPVRHVPETHLRVPNKSCQSDRVDRPTFVDPADVVSGDGRSRCEGTSCSRRLWLWRANMIPFTWSPITTSLLFLGRTFGPGVPKNEEMSLAVRPGVMGVHRQVA